MSRTASRAHSRPDSSYTFFISNNPGTIMYNLDERKASFDGRELYTSDEAHVLSVAGFICRPSKRTPDRIQCAYCHTKVRNWKGEGADHVIRTHRERCEYMDRLCRNGGLAEIVEEREKWLQELTCIVCMDSRFNTVCTPCGHMFCDRCVKKLIYCAICRTKIRSVVKKR